MLQKAWSDLGESGFAFSILEIVSADDDLEAAEQRHIDSLGVCTGGFNLAPLAGSPKGVIHTAEARAKFSAAGLARHAALPESERMRGESNPASKITQQDVAQIRQLASEGVFQKEIAKRFAITQSNVSRIVKGNRWRDTA